MLREDPVYACSGIGEVLVDRRHHRRGYLVESGLISNERSWMKAAVMRSPGEPLIVEQVAIADPGPSEVLVRVAAAGLCHSDLAFLEGSYEHETPVVLGHESAGIVERVGSDVTTVTVGDRVVTSLSASCGRCPYCREGHSHLCDGRESTRRAGDEPPRISMGGQPVHQFVGLSSFAEMMLVHESTVTNVPPEMPLDKAALLGCGVATGLGAVINTAGVVPAQAVAVIGCGGVGLAAVQGARIVGAFPTIAVDVVDEKLGLARAFGATHVVDASRQDPVGAVLDITGGLGVHHAIEATGMKKTAEQAFAMLCRGGTATVVGLIPGQLLSIPTDQLFYERKIQGSVMGSNDFRRDTPRYVAMYLDGQLNLDDMVTRRIGLDEINEGFADIRAGTVVRSLITFDCPP